MLIISQIVNPFLVFDIDYKVTITPGGGSAHWRTKESKWGVFEGIYYKKKRPNQGRFGLG